MWLFFSACAAPAQGADDPMAPAAVPTAAPEQAVAVFGGGCFWCMESDFDKLAGVLHTTSGYAGGHLAAPTYGDVTSETSGHQEVVRVVFDPARLSYPQLLDHYWRHVDPTDDGGQFCDRGDSYRPVIFAQDAAQAAAAEKSRAEVQARLGVAIVVPVVQGAAFWPAENYHQDFHETNPARYYSYRKGCGRDRRVEEVWAKVKG